MLNIYFFHNQFPVQVAEGASTIYTQYSSPGRDVNFL